MLSCKIMKYLLDTNVVSELASRRPDQRVVDWIDGLDPTFIYLSVITIGELSKGIAKLPPSRRKEELAEWLHGDLLTRFSSRILTLDTAVMLAWGELVARLDQKGQPLPAIDSLITAIALRHDCALVTRNEKDFAETGALTINPWRVPS